MKKGCKFLSIVLIFVLSLSGCKGKSKENKFETGNLSTDEQATWNIFNHNITRGEGGYYYIANSTSEYISSLVGELQDQKSYNIIMFMQDDGSKTVVCSKPECKHNNKECPAWLTTGSEDNSEKKSGNGLTGYNGQQIYYYNGKLYVIYNDEEKSGYSYLVEVTANGSYRKRLFEIGEVDKSYSLVFRDSSVYIYKREGSTSGYDDITATIRRRSLDGNEDEIIQSYTAMGACIYAVKSYGDKLYFLEEEYKREKDANGKVTGQTFNRLGLFAYDYNTHNVEQVIDEEITDYTFDTDKGVLYYYICEDGLYKKDFSDGKITKIYNKEENVTNVAQISYINGKIYMSNSMFRGFYSVKPSKMIIKVLNESGTQENEINMLYKLGISETFFGDNNKIFYKSDIDDSMYYIDINNPDVELSPIQFN